MGDDMTDGRSRETTSSPSTDQPPVWLVQLLKESADQLNRAPRRGQSFWWQSEGRQRVEELLRHSKNELGEPEAPELGEIGPELAPIATRP